MGVISGSEKSLVTGIITTIAGTGTSGYIGGVLGDGSPATAADLYYPWGVAVDTSGNVYICDYYNSKIRKVTSSGIITTFAGGSSVLGDGGPATSASLGNPSCLAVDISSNNVYICDTSYNRIRMVNSTGIITTIAGVGTSGGSGDGGAATAAQLNSPRGVAIDIHGNVYIADTNSQKIRLVSSAGFITTFAGVETSSYVVDSGDGGPASSAHLLVPFSVAVDKSGDNVYTSTSPSYAFYKVRSISVTRQPSQQAAIVSTFSYTGSSQTYTLPSTGCHSLHVLACGAAGGQTYSTAGYGTCIVATVVVPATLQSFYVMVGGMGSGSYPSVNMGWNGGGYGTTNGGPYLCGAGGGGATDFRTVLNDLSTRFMVAAGGGGTGSWGNQYTGYASINGGNGGSVGGSGSAGEYNSWADGSTTGGQGGTQTAGGAAGTSTWNLGSTNGIGNTGSFGVGADSLMVRVLLMGSSSYICSGGGGGGWYGGGSGFWTGGGGGSSYITPSYIRNVVSSLPTNTQNANGYATITCNPLPTVSPTPPPTGPSSQPSAQPSKQPSQQPTSRPSRPSGQPSRQPSGMAVVDIGLNPSILSSNHAPVSTLTVILTLLI